MPDSIFLNYCYFIRFEVLNCYALDKKVLPIFIGRGAKVKKENLPRLRNSGGIHNTFILVIDNFFNCLDECFRISFFTLIELLQQEP